MQKTDILYKLTNSLQSHQGNQLFLLLDPRITDIRLAMWCDVADQVQVIRDLQDKTSSDSECLHLLHIEKNQQSAIELAFEYPQGISGWIISHYSFDLIATHLQRILTINYAAKYYQFRYFDPLVFARLSKTLTQSQIDIFLGPINSWLLMDDASTLLTHPAEFIIGENKLQFRPRQWRAILQIPLVIKTIEFCQKRQSEPLSESQITLIEQAIDDAQWLGVTTEQDRLTLVQFYLLFGLNTMHSYRVKQLAKKTLSKQQPLIEQFKQQSSEFWQDVKEHENDIV